MTSENCVFSLGLRIFSVKWMTWRSIVCCNSGPCGYYFCFNVFITRISPDLFGIIPESELVFEKMTSENLVVPHHLEVTYLLEIIPALYRLISLLVLSALQFFSTNGMLQDLNFFQLYWVTPWSGLRLFQLHPTLVLFQPPLGIRIFSDFLLLLETSLFDLSSSTQKIFQTLYGYEKSSPYK